MGRMKTLLTSSAVNLAPVHGEWRGQGGAPGGGFEPDNPPALFLIGRRGQPACWSPFANLAGNYNVAVTGKSGSGKSVLMQELVTGIVGAGGGDGPGIPARDAGAASGRETVEADGRPFLEPKRERTEHEGERG